MSSLQVPIPTTFEQIFWTSLGLMFGRVLGKKLDYEIQQTEWYKKLSVLQKNIFKRSLDLMHHWWVGAFIMLYIPTITVPFTTTVIPLFWFGAGLLLDDLPDVPKRLMEAVTK